MIPYFQVTTFHLGPIPLQAWGLMVACGILTALLLFAARVRRRGGDPEFVWRLATPLLVGAFLGARLVHIMFYDFGFYRENPGEILKIWHGGMSSLGGFIGAAVGLCYAKAHQKWSWQEFVTKYLDDGMLSFWLGWGIGRIGCFLIHDHPGTLTHFVGGVRYPDGVRHDLGLYESIVGFGLFLACLFSFSWFMRKGKGYLAGFSVAAYAAVRIYLDTLRTVDMRYAGLTPAQWGMILVLVALTGWFTFGRLKQSSTEKAKTT